jgi:hypothetical protein
MNNFFEDSADLDRDVVDLLAKAGRPPEEEAGLLFSPRPHEVFRAFSEWNEQWRAHLDNSYYFRSEVADEIFEFDGVKCSIVKNTAWMEALETRNWSKHGIYGYNGYALFAEVPYLFDNVTGSREEEMIFARAIDAYGGVDLTHLDQHGWLCAFSASHDWDRDNPGRTDKVWMEEQIVKMVVSITQQSRLHRVVQGDAPTLDNSHFPNMETAMVAPREAFGIPCYWTDEVTGQLAPAVVAYQQGQELSRRQIAVLRTYFRQWIQSRVWDMNTHATINSRRALLNLRESVESIGSPDGISQWLYGARQLGMDPLR